MTERASACKTSRCSIWMIAENCFQSIDVYSALEFQCHISQQFILYFTLDYITILRSEESDIKC